MTILQRITTAKQEFVARYGQYPNMILVGPNAELELSAYMDQLSTLGLTRPTDAREAMVLNMRQILTPDIQDFIVCLIHDHTV